MQGLEYHRPAKIFTSVALLGIAVYIALALLTYSPFDPGWSHLYSDTQSISNAMGIAGAYIVDTLLAFWGNAAYCIPLFLLFEAMTAWRTHRHIPSPYRQFGYIFIMVVISVLATIYLYQPNDYISNGAGGIIGFELARSLLNSLSKPIITLLLTSMLLLLTTLTFGIRWLTLLRLGVQLPKWLKHTLGIRSSYDAQRTIKKPFTPPPTTSAQDDISTAQPPRPQYSSAATTPLATTSVTTTATNTATTRPTTHALFPAHLLKKPPISAKKALAAAANRDLFEPLFADDVDDIDNDMRSDINNNISNDKSNDMSDAYRYNITPDTVLTSHNTTTANNNPIAPSAPPAIDAHIDHTSWIEQNRQWQDPNTPPATVIAPTAQTNAQNHTLATKANTHTPLTTHNTISPITSNDSHTYPAEADDPFSLFAAQLAADTATAPSVPAATISPSSHPIHNESTQPSIIPAQPASTDVFSHFLGALDTPSAPQPTASNAKHIAIPTDAPQHRNQTNQPSTTMQSADTSMASPLQPQPQPQPQPQQNAPMSRAMQTVAHRAQLSPIPPLSLLDPADNNKKPAYTEVELAQLNRLLEIKLREFNIKAEVVEATPGPVVTRFEIELAPGVVASKVSKIANDLARSLSMESVRVIEVIPGKPYIGIEVPNPHREMVRLSELLNTPTYQDPKIQLSMAMGKDIAGNPVLTDLAKAPHMLIAGTTGSGKSVAVNAMLLSLLLKYPPEQLRLILVDPKQLELSNYADIPHLLTPVVTDMSDAVNSLNWCVNEMERRYKLLTHLKVRNLEAYNNKINQAIANHQAPYDPLWKSSDSALGDKAPTLKPMPLIVVVADEFADMIMQTGKKAEDLIQRLAQKSRACGIHLILATQRPSVDVITGLIKANIPTRVALRVNSGIDSKTILDSVGAESLLGHGDMLFLAPGKNKSERVHGAFISDDEVNRICDAWRERGYPEYVDEILTPYESPGDAATSMGADDSARDPMFDLVVSYVLEERKVSASLIQRKFSLGFNRSARIVDQMEAAGVISAMGSNGKRDILV